MQEILSDTSLTQINHVQFVLRHNAREFDCRHIQIFGICDYNEEDDQFYELWR